MCFELILGEEAEQPRECERRRLLVKLRYPNPVMVSVIRRSPVFCVLPSAHFSAHVSIALRFVSHLRRYSKVRGADDRDIVGNSVDGNPRRPTEWLVYCLDCSLNGEGLQRRRERM